MAVNTLGASTKRFANRLALGLRHAAIGVLRIYQICLSPMLGPHCRFEPTCSHYAAQAIQTHGLRSGGWLALRRILRCHPIRSLGGGQGFDPVPETSPASRKDWGAHV